MKRTKNRMRLCSALLAVNLAFIWGNSLLPGEISGAISDWVKSLLFGTAESGGEEGGFLIRKLAHFTEFTALGMGLAWLCGMQKQKREIPMLLGVTAACVDETIQVFVPDRGPSLKDVALDSCGVLTGIILLLLGHSYYTKKTKT